MSERRLVAIVLAVFVVRSFAAAEQTCYGPGDINRDGNVDLVDHTLFAACLGGVDVGTPPNGCDAPEFDAADLDQDGDVDMLDFACFAGWFDSYYFDYGPHRDNLEAERLAIALTGELRAPDAEYERILNDLADIRAAYPKLEQVIADPQYRPYELGVGLVEGEPTDGYEALNAFYQVVGEEIYSWGRVLRLCDNLNTPLLGVEYAALPEVEWADPPYYIGMDDYITVIPLGATYHYSIDDGWWDCYDGCDCHRYWELEVDEFGTVTLISYEEWGYPWCEF